MCPRDVFIQMSRTTRDVELREKTREGGMCSYLDVGAKLAWLSMEEKSEQDCAKAIVVQRWQVPGENIEALAYSMQLDRTNFHGTLQDVIATSNKFIRRCRERAGQSVKSWMCSQQT